MSDPLGASAADAHPHRFRSHAGRRDGVDGWPSGHPVGNSLQQVERRCALTHELVHLERGHEGCQEPCTEYEVCVETARRLIPIDTLCAHSVWATSVHELAEELWVTPQVVADQLQSLTPTETAQLALVQHQTR